MGMTYLMGWYFLFVIGVEVTFGTKSSALICKDGVEEY